MSTPIKVLMVEDSVTLSAIYSAYLQDTDYHLASVETLGMAHTALSAFQPDIVLLDVELPDGNGLDFLTEAASQEHPPKVIVMTAFGTSDMAVKAIQAGASDFLTKPFDAARLKVTLDNTAARLQLGKRAQELAQLERDSYCNFIGKSLAMQSVYKTIDSLALSDATGFIVGESGTGKELAAEGIHQQSPRRDAEFIAINCGAIPSELMESELFGHVKGAFTGASANREGAASIANGGTLFLDEICEMSLELQKKLLRFIQTGTFRKVGSNTLETVDIRFVCATNRNPLAEVSEGRFREDLFYRLHVVPLHMPPLREREDDVLMLANHFLQHFGEQAGKHFEGFSEDAAAVIRRYPWPGNVRQLQNAMQQVVVLNDGQLVTEATLPTSITSGPLGINQTPADISAATTASVSKLVAPEYSHLARRQQIEPLWVTEKKAIEAAIAACDNNVNRAAGLLEIAPSTLYRKIQAWKQLQA
ncbi:sigma-54-dependent Fis family transcriptional regulator [Halieaceae bacterium IMCC14734]|uniref:Sigma-54-dependent Fis family transcriptional regulator n=1 Tax=Candidatus Litorirhabdus singularis TaxID=2518993 RepID=A0ABT3TE55_9GAMM|nr:sigma-54 dependent transcriptional regulator [Candidatus Litorirhabdus singularis]MCX2980590.1 sigma-54-dependent Fis family transcriptional regulator [Candidatus Litorirhabdus singularis]